MSSIQSATKKTKSPADLAEEGLGGLDEAAVLVEGRAVRRRDLARQPPDRRQPPRHVAFRRPTAQVLQTASVDHSVPELQSGCSQVYLVKR